MTTYLGTDDLSPKLQRSSGLLVWLWRGVECTMVPIVGHGGNHPPSLLCENGVVIEAVSQLLLTLFYGAYAGSEIRQPPCERVVVLKAC